MSKPTVLTGITNTGIPHLETMPAPSNLLLLPAERERMSLFSSWLITMP